MNVENLNVRTQVIWSAGKSESDAAFNNIARDALIRRIQDQSPFDNKTISSARTSGEEIAKDIRQKKRRRTEVLTVNENGSLSMTPEEWKSECRRNSISA